MDKLFFYLSLGVIFSLAFPCKKTLFFIVAAVVCPSDWLGLGTIFQDKRWTDHMVKAIQLLPDIPNETKVCEEDMSQ